MYYIYIEEEKLHIISCCCISLHENTISRWGLGYGDGEGTCSVYMPRGMQLQIYFPYSTLNMRMREYYWYVMESS